MHQGGMTPYEALKTATVNGAYYLGLDHQLGSLETGKLADLVVLDKNPLEDIRNSNSVIYTMVNGRLYETETMNQVGNEPSTRTKFWWEMDGYHASFDWHAEVSGTPQCICGKH